jgi:hypothetical protein
MISSPAVSSTISGVAGSRLPDVVGELMTDIGRDSDSVCEAVHDIYLFTGRAHWEGRIVERLGLRSSSAKALIGLLSNIV